VQEAAPSVQRADQTASELKVAVQTRVVRLGDGRAHRGEHSGQEHGVKHIERVDEHHYRISLAVAGFAEKDLNVEVKESVLTVQGKREGDKETPRDKHYLYQGIAGRSFERRFQLAENVEVKGAQLANGLLHVDLERIVPEEKRPRRVAINGNDGRVIEAKKAA
jgi:molecular chaperone IbpA